MPHRDLTPIAVRRRFLAEINASRVVGICT
jgi:hypothetical protein